MLRAARNESKSVAVLRWKIEVKAPSGSLMAVHSRVIGGWSLSLVSTSLRTGPCRVERTVMVTGSPPATLIVSVRVSNGIDWPAYR